MYRQTAHLGYQDSLRREDQSGATRSAKGGSGRGDMQLFRWTVPVLTLLILADVSRAHAQKTIKPQDSAWVKLCEKANEVTKDKDGKDEKKEVNICLTHHERLDGKSGMVLVSAAVRQIEGRD